MEGEVARVLEQDAAVAARSCVTSPTRVTSCAPSGSPEMAVSEDGPAACRRTVASFSGFV
jgi:hypothetical protein